MLNMCVICHPLLNSYRRMDWIGRFGSLESFFRHFLIFTHGVRSHSLVAFHRTVVLLIFFAAFFEIKEVTRKQLGDEGTMELHRSYTFESLTAPDGVVWRINGIVVGNWDNMDCSCVEL